MSISGGPDTVEQGLILSLDAANVKSYPGTGTTWYDLSGNARNGTLTNSPTFDSGNGGNIVFDGIDDVVTVSSSNLNNCDYAVEAWFLCNTINRLNGVIGDLQFDWWAIHTQVNNTIRVRHKESDALGGPTVVSTSQIEANKWYHVVMTFNTTLGMKLYINGTLNNSTSNTQPFTLTNRGPQYIGQYRDGASTSPRVLDGKIAMVRIYKNKELTAQEVLQNFNAQRSRFGL